MQILSIDGLYACSYSAQPLNALKQYWRTQKSFSCIGEPKKTDILLFLCGCRAEYTLPDGRKLFAQSGDIVYTPKGCQYTVSFLDFEDRESHTVGVNFALTDERGEAFLLSEDILILSNPGCGTLFTKLAMYGEAAVKCPSRMKAALYDILSNLSEASRSSTLSREKFGLIAKGIACLEQETTQKRSIRETVQCQRDLFPAAVQGLLRADTQPVPDPKQAGAGQGLSDL